MWAGSDSYAQISLSSVLTQTVIECGDLKCQQFKPMNEIH